MRKGLSLSWWPFSIILLAQHGDAGASQEGKEHLRWEMLWVIISLLASEDEHLISFLRAKGDDHHGCTQEGRMLSASPRKGERRKLIIPDTRCLQVESRNHQLDGSHGWPLTFPCIMSRMVRVTEGPSWSCLGGSLGRVTVAAMLLQNELWLSMVDVGLVDGPGMRSLRAGSSCRVGHWRLWSLLSGGA